jgi:hypothetical protein
MAEQAKKKFLEHHDILKQERRKIIVLDVLPVPAGMQKCKAKTMAGVPCSFRATKGGFCSRHSIK